MLMLGGTPFTHHESCPLKTLSFVEDHISVISLVKAEQDRWPAPHLYPGTAQPGHIHQRHLPTNTQPGSHQVRYQLDQDINILIILKYLLSRLSL